MQLKAWLELVDKSSDEFGKEIGVDGATVRRYCLGQRVPRTGKMRQIMEATQGAVTANDFVAASATPMPATLNAA